MSDYLRRLEQQAETDARDADVTANVLTGGQVGMTVSMRAALGARAGIWRWCVLCRLLSWFVQKNHCEETLKSESTVPASVYWRAGFCFVAVTVVAAALSVALLRTGWYYAAALAAAIATTAGPMFRRKLTHFRREDEM